MSERTWLCHSLQGWTLKAGGPNSPDLVIPVRAGLSQVFQPVYKRINVGIRGGLSVVDDVWAVLDPEAWNKIADISTALRLGAEHRTWIV